MKSISFANTRLFGFFYILIQSLTCIHFSVAEFQFFQPFYNVSEDSEVVTFCLELTSGILTEDVAVEVTAFAVRGMSGCKLKPCNLR